MPAQFNSWDSYFWEPGGAVLRNLYGERDGVALARKEYAETSAQQFDIERRAVEIPKTYDAEHLQAIHRQLFGNVYEWAGEYRTVGIRKEFTDFAAPSEIPRYLDDATRLIKSAQWPTMNRDQFAEAAAGVFAYVNQAHPFREGNGRTSKLFMQHVAELSPFRIDYNAGAAQVTAAVWNQASKLSGPDRGAYEPVPDSLVPVFRALTVDTPSVAPAAPPGVAPGRAERRASYPRAATEALRQRGETAAPATLPATPNRPEQQHGQRPDVGLEG